jgi:hypothetical protein
MRRRKKKNNKNRRRNRRGGGRRSSSELQQQKWIPVSRPPNRICCQSASLSGFHSLAPTAIAPAKLTNKLREKPHAKKRKNKMAKCN